MTLRNCLHLTYDHNANRYIEPEGGKIAQKP